MTIIMTIIMNIKLLFVWLLLSLVLSCLKWEHKFAARGAERWARQGPLP